MENFVTLLIPGLLAILLLRVMMMPVALAVKLAVHSSCGFLCLWILNAFTGIGLPVNAVTVLTAGFLGLPGIALITLLELI